MRKIEYFVANPAGNITIFVTSEVERKDYQEVAKHLLAIEEHKAEQLGYIKKDDRMEMCGLEFCGNASRSFALYLAKKRGIEGEAEFPIEVSGSDTPLLSKVNTLTNYTKIEMPLPEGIYPWEGENGETEEPKGVLVDLGGIIHLVLWDGEATASKFDKYKKIIESRYDKPALGVMFFDEKTNKLTPIVYVKDVDTVYFEGSCGSGSTAVAIALSRGLEDGEHAFELVQPAGTITASVLLKDKKIDKVYIEGPVDFGKPLVLEIE